MDHLSPPILPTNDHHDHDVDLDAHAHVHPPNPNDHAPHEHPSYIDNESYDDDVDDHYYDYDDDNDHGHDEYEYEKEDGDDVRHHGHVDDDDDDDHAQVHSSMEYHDHHHNDANYQNYGYNTCPNEFNHYYCAFPFSTIDKTHLEPGNKVILPLSALDELMSIGVGFPMLFSIENPTTGQTSHCGVLEFSAEEGMAFIPSWLMKNLSLENGELVKLKNVTLERASYIKLQPHSVDFLDIRNPKEVLEASFCGGYSCLTIGDTIMIMNEEGKKFVIDVIDAKPSRAVCVLETDCEVDFSPPLDYKEPSKEARVQEEEEEDDEELSNKFVPFSGRARRLNEEEGNRGKEIVGNTNLNIGEVLKKKNRVVFGGISSSSPPTSSKMGSNESCECDQAANKEHSFKPFTGKKYTLKD